MIRNNTALTLLLLLVAGSSLLGYLIGPRIPDHQASDYCVSNHQIFGPFGHSLNCDSADFMRTAADPSQLLAPDAIRQGRPGASTLVSVVSLPFVAFQDFLFGDYAIQRNFDPKRAGEPVEQNKERYLPYYPGFLVFHAAVLLLSFLLYLKIIGKKALASDLGVHAAVWVGLILIANNITKQFFWSPHTQLLNILVPVFAIYGALCIHRAEKGKRLVAYAGLAACAGIGQLFYGVFVIGIATIGLMVIAASLRDRGATFASLREILIANAIAVPLFAAPSLAWYAYVVSVNGAFFQYDVERANGFVWILPVWEQGGLWAAAWAELASMARFAGMAVEQFWLGLLILLAIVLVRRSKPALRYSSDERAVLLGAGLFAILVTVFYGAYGYHVYRLAFSPIVPLIVALGYGLKVLQADAPRRWYLPATVSCLLVYVGWQVAKFGPYS